MYSHPPKNTVLSPYKKLDPMCFYIDFGSLEFLVIYAITHIYIYIFHRELDLKHIRVFIFGALDDSLMIFDDFRRETHL